MVPWGDKIGHLVCLASLPTSSTSCSAPAKPGWARHVLKGSALVAAAVSLEECSQLYFPSRTFDLGDLAADFAGIWLAGRLAILYLAFRTPSMKAAPATKQQ